MFLSARPHLTRYALESRHSEEIRAPLGTGRLAIQRQSWNMEHLKGPRTLEDKPWSVIDYRNLWNSLFWVSVSQLGLTLKERKLGIVHFNNDSTQSWLGKLLNISELGFESNCSIVQH